MSQTWSEWVHTPRYLRLSNPYVIRCLDEERAVGFVPDHFDEAYEPLYWNNSDGWGNLDNATIFATTQADLPIGGVWEEVE
jgi:hypothetical protein